MDNQESGAQSAAVQAEQSEPAKLDENALNDAAWEFIYNAPPNSIPPALWNNLKAALRPSIALYMAKAVAAPAAPSEKAEPTSIRDHADFVEDILRLSQPGTARSTLKAIRKDIYDTIDARVRNFAARAAAPAAPLPAQPEPLATITLGGIEGDELGNIDIEIIDMKRLEALQYQMVRTEDPVYLHLYALADAAPLPELTGPTTTKGEELFGLRKPSPDDAADGWSFDRRNLQLMSDAMAELGYSVEPAMLNQMYLLMHLNEPAASPSPAPAQPDGPLYEEQPDGTITQVDPSDWIIAKQVAVWRKEVERLNDLIAVAGGRASPDRALPMALGGRRWPRDPFQRATGKR